MNKSHLSLSPDEMKDLGYQAVDILVEHFYQLHEKKVGAKVSRHKLNSLVSKTLPEKGESYEKVLQETLEQVFAHVMHTDHPRFFGWVPGPGNYVSAVADMLASGFNVFSGVWLVGSGAAQVELTTIQWLVQLMHMPEGAGGQFVNGGSVANLTGLAVARQIKLNNQISNAVVYCSDQTHSSNDRALKILNFAPEQLVKIPADKNYRLDIRQLSQQIEADREAGKKPFCVIANAGTTNTGAVDPLVQIHELCRKEGLWMHVDGAYGAAGMLTGEGKKLLAGISMADSLTLDPHKWLFQPYEIGCLLVKDRRWLSQTFETSAAYLKDIQPEEEEHNFSNSGIQLTRNFKALKLWMSFRVFGVEAFGEAIGRGMHLARVAENAIAELPAWEIVTPAQLGILTFRFAPEGKTLEELNAINKALVARMMQLQYAILSSTILHNRTVLRMCTINPRTTEEDIAGTAATLHKVAREILKSQCFQY